MKRFLNSLFARRTPLAKSRPVAARLRTRPRLEVLEDRFMPAVAGVLPDASATLLNFSGGFAQSQAELTFNGSASLQGSRGELTNGGFSEAGSVFSNRAVDITRFTTQFDFQLSKGANIADGITFTIQNDSPTALGPGGGGLGYGPDFAGGAGGIANSVAIKFDLYNNQGEGVDSTGLFTNGAAPTSHGAINLAPAGIDLHSGDIFQVNMAYNGTTLSVNIHDIVTGRSELHNYAINIPGVIGNTTAHVGFTGGTGALVATQEILSWTFDAHGAALPTGARATTVFVTSNAAAGALAGHPVTFTAHVADLDPRGGIPTGTVQFQIDGAAFGRPVVLHGGLASITTSSLSAGSHTILAFYTSNSSRFASSDSQADPLTEDVIALASGLRAQHLPGDTFPVVDPFTHLGSATIEIINAVNVAHSGPIELAFHLPPGFTLEGSSGTIHGLQTITVDQTIPASTQTFAFGLPPGTLRIVVTIKAPPTFRGFLPIGQIDVFQ